MPTQKEVERRRRDAITKGINDLAELITPRIDSTNKSDILSAAIDYVCSLQRAKAQLENDLARAREQAQEGVHVELLAELAQARREAKEAHEARRRAETMILEWRADDEGERERKRVRCAYHEKDG
jgi:multidrug efflux pump subunit AcrA (membrane-fusion protein)